MLDWQTKLAHLVSSVTGRSETADPDEPLPPAFVYLLADNLDAALAAGEDLQKESFVWNRAALGTPREIADALGEQRASVETIRSLEMILVARVLKSRERAEELARRDTRFAPVAKLYNAGTALLIEGTAEYADATLSDFENGQAMTAYLRSRGLIAAEKPAPHDGERILIGDEFRIARRIKLGELMNLVAMFLDVLETHYDLFGEAAAAGAPALLADDEEPADALDAHDGVSRSS